MSGIPKPEKKRGLLLLPSRPLAGGEYLSSSLAVVALGLIVRFTCLPILSLVVWTVDREAWHAMVSPTARDALLLSIRTTADPLRVQGGSARCRGLCREGVRGEEVA